MLTWTTVMLSRPIVPTVPIEPPNCSCLAAWASRWTCCCCCVGAIRRNSWGSSPIYTWRHTWINTGIYSTDNAKTKNTQTDEWLRLFTPFMKLGFKINTCDSITLKALNTSLLVHPKDRTEQTQTSSDVQSDKHIADCRKQEACLFC